MRPKLDHCVIHVSDWEGNSDLCFEWPGSIQGAVAHLEAHRVEVEEGPVARTGAKGAGTSVYFRDPDGSLVEFISYVS
jgi:catechol 2,3-dioxygenase-like lactoylglutathione lyase family enzyme